GHPIVVVLTNPHRARVILGEQECLWALEGDPVVRVPVGPVANGSPVHTVGHNGELRHDHPYLTAVVLLHKSLWEPHEHSATVFIPSSEAAVPLADVFFRGPRDRVLEYSFERQGYVGAPDPGGW